jgi:hypothetical protein
MTTEEPRSPISHSSDVTNRRSHLASSDLGLLLNFQRCRPECLLPSELVEGQKVAGSNGVRRYGEAVPILKANWPEQFIRGQAFVAI